jgi:hypothetical protein
LDLSFGADGKADLHLAWEDGDRILCRDRHQDGNGHRRAVLAVVSAEHPSPASIARFTREYALKDELDGAFAVRPLELVRDGGRAILVL